MNDKFNDMEDRFDDLEEKFTLMENLNEKLLLCTKRVTDLCSMQGKANEIAKMNNQSVIHQINQYEEEISDIEHKNNAMYNSVETAEPNGCHASDQPGQNNRCFVKLNETSGKDKEMFYMSSNNEDKPNGNNTPSKNQPDNTSKHNTSTRNKDDKPRNDLDNNSHNNIFQAAGGQHNRKPANLKIVTDSYENSNTAGLEEFINSLPEGISKDLFKRPRNESDTSTILVMNGEFVTHCDVETNTPKFENAMRILNEMNVIKNNSHNKLNELNDSDNAPASTSKQSIKIVKDTTSDTSSKSNIEMNDPPPIMMEFIKNMMNNNNNSKIVVLN
ncbi:MAG: hypothetical protein Gaeavirus9_11 [Gaeavirus sp.]|uniref:Uncharacterized protein n=1 Tax=Gaeavirus sp. TaxID=2487767 RepID=A0A3G5A1P0_9VIRU|nr:MAG: hypothetical protein Gaeavirus9_11 [Gaeavirus sp.]